MTLKQFRDIILTADPNASHYFSTKKPDYTVWTEFGDRAGHADDARMEEEKIWNIQVDRYTTIEYDPVVDAIRDALNAAEIPFEYLVDFDQDTKLLHHIFDCEAA